MIARKLELTGCMRYRPHVHTWTFRPPEVLLVLQVEYVHEGAGYWRDATVEDLAKLQILAYQPHPGTKDSPPCGTFG